MRHFSKASRFKRDGGELGGRARATRGQEVHHVEHLEGLNRAKEHGEHQEGQHHRQRDRPELPPRRGAIDLGRLVDVIGDRAEPREADQHDIGRPHPGIDEHDGPGRQADIADHLEGARRNADEEAHDIVEEPDLRLEKQRPEIADDGGRQHHRQEDDRRPEAVGAELTVDEQRQTEADDHLQRNRPDDEMRCHLHALPDILIGQDVDVVGESDEAQRRVRQVRFVIGEREPDRPEQRKDIDRQQQHDRRRDEEPGDAAIGEAADAPGDAERGSRGDAVDECLGSLAGGHRDLSEPAGPPARGARGPLPSDLYISLPSSLKTLVQSLTRRSSASLAVPLSATT